MSSSPDSNDKITRVAHAIWEAEGRPDGREHEHWSSAELLIEEGRAEAEYPDAFAADAIRAPRPVQPGFEDVPPGIVPSMEDDTDADLAEGPAGRFARQIAGLPDGSGKTQTPGPRNHDPIPISSADDLAAGAVNDNPVDDQTPPSGGDSR